MNTSISKREKTILYFGLASLITLVFLNTRSPFYDEILYLRDVEVLHQYGLGKEYLLRLTGSAGPLYSIVHYTLEPITHLQAPVIRLVNLVFLLGVMYFLQKTISLQKNSIQNYSLCCLAIPLTYVVAGLALTEMPAMFFLSIGLYLIIFGESNQNSSFPQRLLYMAAGGICLSMAIIGRQPYLAILFAIPLLFKDDLINKWKVNIVLLSVAILFSIALPSFVFWTWKGLVPPIDAILYDDIAKAGISFQPKFFFFCVAYFALIFLLISPFFYPKWNRQTWLLITIGYVTISIINYFSKLFLILPFFGITKKIFVSAESQMLASTFIGAGLLLCAVYFLYILCIRMISNLSSKYFLFYSAAAILLAVTCIKVTWGFSSRYAAQAIPLLIPISVFFYKKDSWLYLLVGILIGSCSLISYIIS